MWHYDAVTTRQQTKSLELKSTSHIRYLPRSSSFRPSSHLRSSSLVAGSEALADFLEVFKTSSSTKMGQSTRKASARASDGRESTLITRPSRSIQITPRNESSF